nr:DUF2771 family protein [Gordonia araii]
MSASEKKFLALLGVAVLVFSTVVVGAGAFWASRTDVDHRPYATISVGSTYTQAYPTVLCDRQLAGCDGDFRKNYPDRHTRFPVPIGQTMRVRLSPDVADDPWAIVAQYLTPTGSELVLKTFRPFTGNESVYLASTRERVLINVEISLPAGLLAGDSDDQLVRRGYFAINTTPTDQKDLIDAYEKAATGKEPKQRMVDDVEEFAKR